MKIRIRVEWASIELAISSRSAADKLDATRPDEIRRIECSLNWRIGRNDGREGEFILIKEDSKKYNNTKFLEIINQQSY